MKSLKKGLSCLLSASILTACLCVPASAAQDKPAFVNNPTWYVDVSGHWAEKSLSSVLMSGVMTGTTAETVSPDKDITRAEMATMMVRALEADSLADISDFTDVDADAWYYKYLRRAVFAGIINGDGAGHLRPEASITREEAAVILYNSFNLYGYTANLETFEDYNKVSSWAENAMAACVSIGAINPKAQMLNPQAFVTRADFSAMLYSVVQDYNSTKVCTHGDSIEGSMLLTDGEAGLHGVTVKGNLYIVADKGSAPVKLSGVYVNGKCYVLSGGGVELCDGTEVSELVVCSNTDTTIKTDASSQVYSTIVTTTEVVTLSGNLGDLFIKSTQVDVNIEKSYIHEFKEGKRTSVTVDSATVVDKMSYDGAINKETGEEYQAYLTLPLTGKNAVVGSVQVTQYNPIKLLDKYKLTTAEMVDGLTFAAGKNDNTLTIGGTIKYTKVGDDSTYAGYYVPLRLLVRDEADEYTVTINKTKFTDLSSLATGDGSYLNILVPFSSSQKTATIKFTPVSGSKAAEVTLKLQLDNTVKFKR